MDAKTKITKAKVQLTIAEPFFSSIALGLEYIEDPSVKTGCTDGKCIRWNPIFIDRLTLDETVFFIAHEVGHIVGLHHTRMGARKLKRFNKAADYAINPLLVDSGLKMIEGALYDEQYRGMSAEQIYNLLPDEPEDGEGDDPGGCGGIIPVEDGSVSGKEKEEQEVREKVSQALNNAKKQGNLPGWMKRAIDEMVAPKVDWKEVLARFLSEVSRDDYSFRKPNMRFIHTGFYLPSLYSEKVGDIVLGVDTSGSINQELLNKIAGEMQQIASDFSTGFTIVYVDTEVQGIQYIEPDEDFKLTPKGGGGTNFSPLWKWMEEQAIEPKAVVYFTDLYCNDFPPPPDHPVLWVKYGGWKGEVPFGEVVEINE